jgi:hypothetical protein
MRFGLTWLTIAVVTLLSVAAVRWGTDKHPAFGLLLYFAYIAAVAGAAFGLSVVMR